MNKFDKALECLDEYKLEFTMPGICDDIRLLNSRQNKHIKKAIELGKLYQELIEVLGIKEHKGAVNMLYQYDIEKAVSILLKIKEIENE